MIRAFGFIWLFINTTMLLAQKPIEYVSVAPFGDTLFMISQGIGNETAKERAQLIEGRITDIANQPLFEADSFYFIPTEDSYTILCGSKVIVTIRPLDTIGFGLTHLELVKKYTKSIVSGVEAYENEWSQRSMMLKAFQGVVTILLFSLLIYLANRLTRFLKRKIVTSQDKYVKALKIKNIEFLNQRRMTNLYLNGIKLLRIFIILLAFYFVVPILISIFPWTNGWAKEIRMLMLSPVKEAIFSTLGYIPNLIRVVIIWFIFYYIIKGVRFLMTEIKVGTLKLNGFYADWAMPTFNILRFLLYAFMLVIIFPYLPGSDSPAFKGVTVFMGILFSLGSSSAISNMVAGLVITYMRPYKVGDRVIIGNVTGDVVEKSLLVTRIKTIKNEDITVPNSTVLSGVTINLSSHAHDHGLIIHTEITIGYDASWKKVHELLIAAALKTSLILKEPLPFVLQTALNDYYVTYQINAYTKESNRIAAIYSELHQHIQDTFNEAGVEIMSPHYTQLRDGNTTTIPEDYRAADYKPKGFKVE